MEQENKPKMTFSEKRASSVQAKLLKLREKITSNPPKTFLGKKLAVARLNRLSNIVDRKILRNNIEADYKTGEYKAYEKYYSDQESLMGNLSNFHMQREAILRQLKNLKRFDLNSNKFIYASQQKRIVRNMPKGFEPKASENKTEQPNAKASQKIQILEQRLEEIEKEIARNEEKLKQNNTKYKEFKVEMEQQKKEYLALVSPNLFTRIGRFFSSKGKQFTEWIGKKSEQFKKWREEKLERADENLSKAMENSAEPSEREMFLQANAGNISQNEARNSETIQKELDRIELEQKGKGREPGEEENIIK